MKPHKSGRIAIVDAYSAGAQLAPEFRARGWEVLHVQSAGAVPNVYANSFRPQDFSALIVATDDFDGLAERLQREEVSVVIAGAEPGVPLADRLTEQLGLPGNGTLLSNARRHKGLMAETVAASGLPVPQFIRARTAEHVIVWVRQNGIHPVVVKPPESAGTDRVSICHSEVEICRACENILYQQNQLGIQSAEVIAQELLEGAEYVVNAVSWAGERQVTEVVRYEKNRLPSGAVVYARDHILCPDDDAIKPLIDYTVAVLGALEINYGPAHAELWLTENGPRLMEVGARIDGLANPPFHRIYSSINQIDSTVSAYTNSSQFRKSLHTPGKLRRAAAVCYLISERQGVIKSMPALKDIRSLKSYHSERLKVCPGEPLVPTVDLFTSPGYIYLAHDDPGQLEADYQRIRDIEKEDLFELN